ncbi:hypothetical protein [Komagataeibacter europaeus]|uniref:hypothetical protein n=1 Tax=Komagataeibacter europaeus TaxID=33995 RepID=UPI0011DD1A0C|nr:hypothetical protein [Komagataeibacter europaeus]
MPAGPTGHRGDGSCIHGRVRQAEARKAVNKTAQVAPCILVPLDRVVLRPDAVAPDLPACVATGMFVVKPFAKNFWKRRLFEKRRDPANLSSFFLDE